MRDLPHMGGVAGRLDVAAVRRTVGEIATLLAEREQRFAAAGIDSMAAYRRQQAAAASGQTISAATADDPWATCSWSSTAGPPCVVSTTTWSR